MDTIIEGFLKSRSESSNGCSVNDADSKVTARSTDCGQGHNGDISKVMKANGD
jgi:hypothetical protein